MMKNVEMSAPAVRRRGAHRMDETNGSPCGNHNMWLAVRCPRCGELTPQCTACFAVKCACGYGQPAVR